MEQSSVIPKRSNSAPGFNAVSYRLAIVLTVFLSLRKPMKACCIMQPLAAMRYLYCASHSTFSVSGNGQEPIGQSLAIRLPAASRSAPGRSAGAIKEPTSHLWNSNPDRPPTWFIIGLGFWQNPASETAEKAWPVYGDGARHTISDVTVLPRAEINSEKIVK